MISDITIQHPIDAPTPPPAWLVGGIVATVLFVAAALLAALPPAERSPHAEPVLHSGIVEAAPRSPTLAPAPFDPLNLALPIL